MRRVEWVLAMIMMIAGVAFVAAVLSEIAKAGV